MSATSPKKEQAILLRFAVKSNNPTIDTSTILEQLSNSQEELETVLSREAPVENVSLKRRGNLPIGLETAIITILVEVGKEVSKAVLAKAADEAYTWLKSRWTQAKFEKLSTNESESVSE
jgi:tartrate dehydratase alpha subunit/fumarate hydratase class I-like protein